MSEPTFNSEHEPLVPVVPATLAVYRNLRIGLGITAILLAGSIIVQSTYGPNCWQGALSEYFYTSAHNVFVAGLVGLATLFFVYRGSTDTENALLQLAAVAAMTAALVPQGKIYIDHCTPLFVPDDLHEANVIRLNMVAVVAALAVAWLITLVQHHYDPTDISGQNKFQQKKSKGGKLARLVLWVVVLLGLIALCTPQFDSRNLAHGAAGLLLLSSFIATVFVTAHLANREESSPRGTAFQRFYRCFYPVWGVIMALTLLGIIAVHCLRPEFLGGLWVTYLEGAVLLEFCVYWVVQTFDLWAAPDRKDRLGDADRARLAKTYEPIGGVTEHLGDKIMAFL